ncbi:MAG: tetratricopeptide repeat protein, partial [Acidobacteriota bacterium]
MRFSAAGRPDPEPRLRIASAASALALALALTACGLAEPPIPEPSTYQPGVEEQALLDRLTRHASLEGYTAGIEEARIFLAENPEALRVDYAIGVLYGLSDDHISSFEAFQAAIEKDPGHIASYRGSAIAKMTSGEPQAAVEFLRRASEIAPDDPLVLLELGRFLSNAGELEEALPLLQRAGAGGAEALVELGILHRRRGDLDAAADTFQRALGEDPKALDAMVNLGQTLMALGRAAEGQALLRRHADRATLQDRIDVYQRSSLLAGATAANFLHLGRLHVRSGNRPEAFAAYRRALELAPASTEAMIGLAA